MCIYESYAPAYGLGVSVFSTNFLILAGISGMTHLWTNLKLTCKYEYTVSATEARNIAIPAETQT